MRIPASPPDLAQIMQRIGESNVLEFLAGKFDATSGKYLHWDELRRRPPPDGMSTEEWWLKTKLARSNLYREIPLLDSDGHPFSYCLVDAVLEKLPIIDAQARGSIGISERVINSEHRNRYVVSSLIEEAITSSQLEGAVTTRKVAVDMLRSGRAPNDHSEKMILNNYHAMKEILNCQEEDITPAKIFEIHRIITEGTLDKPEMAGKIQGVDDERVQVWDDSTGTVLHTPPPALELPHRIEAMCEFANRSQEEGKYLHPIVRAITLHFWLAYDHPFEDGNGRTARALFYWSMLKQGYWLFEFVSISSLIREAWAAYARSFLYTETDDNDLTYFIVYQLQLIGRAIENLEKYIERKSREISDIEGYVYRIANINHRQKALIAHALKHPAGIYSIESHGRSHDVAYATSRSDLLSLAELKILDKYKVGKAFKFRVAEDLVELLRGLSNQ